MLTLRAAATLLSSADSLAALRAIARAIGFAGETHAIPLADAFTVASPGRSWLPGLRELASEAELVVGPSELRLLAARLQCGVPHDDAREHDIRALTGRLCTLLVREAPARHWCAITLDDRGCRLCIAVAGPHRQGVRVAALVVERERVVDSDAETLQALTGVSEAHDALRHARFGDILRREALSTRFYRALEHTVQRLSETATGDATPEERHTLALLCASRCLFLSFLETKGWLDGDRNFLLHHVAACLERGGSLHRRLLRPLFFGTLNTPPRQRAAAARALGRVPFLNGGLFAPTPLERRRRSLLFADDALVALVGDLLDRYRFTAREDSTSWSEAAVDPEMLGRAFESMMHGPERRTSGAYYTPPALVDEVVNDALQGRVPSLERIRALRVLDPACGSGAFLVRLLEELADLARRSGDDRPTDVVRRDVLSRCIFGVDRNPMAVWLCELRLWLSVVIECGESDPDRVVPLPNLDHHVHVGDSLAGGDFTHAPQAGRRLAVLRERYTRATGRRKQHLAASLDAEERRRATSELQRRIAAVTHARRDLLSTLRTRDLFGQRISRTPATRLELATLRERARALAQERRRLDAGGALPFRFAAHFADVAAAGGFGLVVGNPPWVRPHAIPATERVRLRGEFRTLSHAAWRTGARRAGASAGFAAQADLAAAFVERSVRLLAPAGTLALLLPSKLWRSLAGGGVRALLLQETRPRHIHDWSDAPAQFDAAVYPSLIVAERCVTPGCSDTEAAPSVTVSVSGRTEAHRFHTPPANLSLGGEPSAPWILLPGPVREAFERIRLAGPALGDSPLGRPTLGVKCGCNAAFLVHADAASLEGDDEVVAVTANGRRGTVERRLLRPALRGEALRGDALRGDTSHGESPPSQLARATRASATSPHLVWTHGIDGAPMSMLPPAAARWLGGRRRQLEARTDSRGRQPWWTLFRTDAARYDRPRLAWADIGKRLRTVVLPAGDPTVPLNSCYVLRLATDDDAWALRALLAAPAIAAWIDALAEPARGGYRRYLGWTVAAVPIPADWPAARRLLAPLGRRLACGTPPSAQALSECAAAAYGLTVREMQPLAEWRLR